MLVILAVVPFVMVAAYREVQPATYAATANIQAQSTEPDAETQVLAILSRVTAIATSPQVVQSAIKAAGVNRDAIQVAAHEITAKSLTSSAVVAVTVTDHDRQVAIRLSRSLANVVVDQLNGLGSQAQRQLAQLAKQRSQLIASRNSLLKQLSTIGLSATDASAQADIAQLNAVETQLANNSTAEQQAQATGYPGAAVISTSPTATGTSRHAIVDAALAALAGLMIGLLIATIRESVRPTLADPGSGAKELGVLYLGTAKSMDDGTPTIDEGLLARLELVSDRRSITTLMLTGPVERSQLTALAMSLDHRLQGTRSNGNAPSTWLPPGFEDVGVTSPSPRNGKPTRRTPASRSVTKSVEPHGLRVEVLSGLTVRSRPAQPALILVLPEFAPKAAVERATDLSATTGWPVLGVIGIQPKRKQRPQITVPRAPVDSQENESNESNGSVEEERIQPAGTPSQ